MTAAMTTNRRKDGERRKTIPKCLLRQGLHDFVYFMLVPPHFSSFSWRSLQKEKRSKIVTKQFEGWCLISGSFPGPHSIFNSAKDQKFGRESQGHQQPDSQVSREWCRYLRCAVGWLPCSGTVSSHNIPRSWRLIAWMSSNAWISSLESRHLKSFWFWICIIQTAYYMTPWNPWILNLKRSMSLNFHTIGFGTL